MKIGPRKTGPGPVNGPSPAKSGPGPVEWTYSGRDWRSGDPSPAEVCGPNESGPRLDQVLV